MFRASCRTATGLGLFYIALLTVPAGAAELGSAEGFNFRWDNSFQYSAGLRVTGIAKLARLYPNVDDGNRDFAAGLTTNRFDLTSVLDAIGENVGAEISLSAWYDFAYQAATRNSSPVTYNAVSAPASRFVAATKAQEGEHVELSDSFVYGNLDLAGMPLSVRFGRQTVLWGESLFFSQNAIEAGQAPVDYDKSYGTPLGYSHESFLPVDQLSFTLQPRSDLSLSGYYQLEWRPSRLPGVGSYFSSSDVSGAGAERAFLSGGRYLLHGADERPYAGGQYGLSLKDNLGDTEIGVYALRYNAKLPVMRLETSPAAPSGYSGTFEAYYPRGIELYGFSFSTYWGETSIAGEISGRRRMPLVSILPVSPTFLAAAAYGGYALGDSLHGQVSAVQTLGPASWWDSADVSFEIAANDRLSVTAGPAALDPNRSRFALSARGLIEPHYFQLLPNLDVTPFAALGWNAIGRSSTDYAQNAGTGDYEIGVSAVYRQAWKAELSLTNFVGVTYRQPLSDRDFLLLRLARTY
jgi:hypothetical protein